MPLIQAVLATICTVIAVADPTPFRVGCAVLTGLMFVYSLALELR